MEKNKFGMACDIITLAGSLVTLGCLIGIKNKDKNKNQSTDTSNTTTNNSTTEAGSNK